MPSVGDGERTTSGSWAPVGARGVVPLAALVVALVAAALTLAAPGSTPAAAERPPTPGTGAPHPRILYSPGEEDLLRDRLTREPYRTIFLRMHDRGQAFGSRPLGDDSLAVHRDLSRAAKILAFQYALDRTVVGGQIVPFPDAASRAAVGDRVRDLLLNLYPRNRMAVPPPLGGPDRDISTSEEIVNYATALDTLLGAGYGLGADREVIVDRLAAVTGELHRNFVDPATAGGFANLHQNNHRSKSGAAMAVAAVVLADDRPAAAADWWDDGVLFVDDVLTYMLVTGDGAYGEGPFYYRFTMQNLAPVITAWDRFLGGASWTARGTEVRSPSASPLFRRTQRWMLDMTLPDGSMAAIDDGNPGRSYYFGLVPSDLPEAPAAYWRWANTPQPFETDGNIDVSPDAIATYDDAVAPRPPWWSPTQFYTEGGTAILRSDWSADAVTAIVLGEHDTAAQFGRDRTGTGRYPQSHEHADPGSFLLNAFGQRLALDPGYLTFPTRTKVNKPQDHNMVLVDGAGPADYLQASLAWGQDPAGRPPAEGMATLHGPLDGDGLDATSVATAYRDTEVHRRFVLADDRYLVIADDVAGSGSSLSWMLHGNGGGTSGGTHTATPTGARWEIGGARLDGAVAVTGTAPTLEAVDAIHEVPFGQERTHTALKASVPSGDADAITLLYPSPTSAPAPSVERTSDGGDAGIVLTDPTGDRRIEARRTTRPGHDGAPTLSVVDERLDGTLRLAYADGTDRLTHGGLTIAGGGDGTLGVRLRDDGTADLVADTPGPTVTVAGLGAAPGTVDGACAASTTGGTTTLTLNRERRVSLRPEVGNARPAADAGADRRVAVGSEVVLDSSASCDAEGTALAPRWELVSAPAGSAWSLADPTSSRPTLRADRTGVYRLRLTVTDAEGATSLEAEVVVLAGPRCGDGVDNDLDGTIDSDDDDCDGVDPPPPTTSTTTATTASTTTHPAPTTTGAPSSTVPTTGAPTTGRVTTPSSATRRGVGAAAPAAAVAASPRFTG